MGKKKGRWFRSGYFYDHFLCHCISFSSFFSGGKKTEIQILKW